MFPSALLAQVEHDRGDVDGLKTLLTEALRKQGIDHEIDEIELHSVLDRAAYRVLDALVEGGR